MSIIQGFIGAVSNTVKYEITANYTSIDEGGTAYSQTVTYTITTGGVADGTTLYWSNAGTTNAADLGGAAQGSVAISGGTATFSLTATTDNTTEGSETIIIRLYKDVNRTQLVATAPTVTVGDSSLDPPVPGSGVFDQPAGDYMSVGAGAHLNLGTTWTIEFWLKANHASDAGINIPGGQWGLLNQHGWYYGIDSNSILIGLTAGNLTIAQTNTNDVQYAEPQAGVWTHVAIVNSAGTQKVFYNGIEQTKVSGSFGGNGWTNVTDDLYIGRLAPPYSSHFDGKITNIRITDQAQYSGNFASAILPTRIVGHTRFLWTPTQYGFPSDTGDSALAITNNGVTYSTDYPTARYAFNTYPSSVDEGSAASFSFRTVAVPNTTLYWEVINALGTSNADFSSASGSFVLANSAGSFSVTAAADFTTEGSESFAVNVRTGANYTGTLVATSPLVAVNDTSIDPIIHGSALFGNGEADYMIVSSTGTYDIKSGPDALGNRYDVGSGLINSIPFAPDGIIETITAGWTVKFNNGDTRTIASVGTFEGTYQLVLDSTFNYTANQVFPLILKSPNFVSRPWYLGNVYTIEFWSKARIASTGSIFTVACQTPATTSIDIFYVDGKLRVSNDGFDVCNEPTPGVWTHVAIVNDSGTITVYYDGVQQYSGFRNITLTDSDRNLVIGKRGEGNYQYFDGKITNMRITNTKVYTGAFVPAVLPLKVTGTKLLWTPTNYGIVTDASDIAGTITNHGATYNTDYPNEFAYEAIQVAGGILTMTKSINGLSVQAAATNFDGSPAAGSYISIDGVIVASDILTGVGQDMTRGHTMVVVNKETNAIVSINTYDTWLTPTSIEAPLAAVAAGRIVILVTYDATSCTPTMRSTLVNSYGATDSTSIWTSNRRSHLFIGTKR